jgi:hypothetical protein
MTLLELKKKVLGLIEELNPNSELQTDDPDIALKINEVINSIMFELARMRKIPKYVEIPVSEGDLLGFADIEKACGYEVYQVSTIGGVMNIPKASGTLFRMTESGTAEVECFVYPERITEKTSDKAYEFELAPDALEIMPYGVAADLLKSDVSVEYGRIYAERYETMLARLDPRYQPGVVWIEGGISV